MGKTAQANRAERRHPNTLPADVELLPWAAEQLGISKATAYRLAATGGIPGLFRVGSQYRISVPRFRAEVHGE
jgi:excisionase family DNA binding protein